MIRSVRIQNFKNIVDQTIEFDRFTVFVGANGSGKSSVLEAIELAAHASPTVQNYVKPELWELDWIYRRGASDPLSIACETDNGQFVIDVAPAEGFSVPADSSHAPDWRIAQTGGVRNQSVVAQGSIGSSRRIRREADIAQPFFEKEQKAVLPLVFLKLDPNRLAEPSYSDTTRPRIEPDGSGAASVLAFMALNDPDSFGELMYHARELLPQITRIRFQRVLIQRGGGKRVPFGEERVGEAILFDYQHAKDVAAHTASEGTLMIVGLLTVLLGPDRPRTLLLDDIEHGLHPLAQKQIVETIKKIMEKFPDLQVIATAHSPYLLNYLEPEQVRIMAADAEGHAHCGRLTDHPKFPTWKDEMAPGEMWSLFGEKWLTGVEAAK